MTRTMKILALVAVLAAAPGCDAIKRAQEEYAAKQGADPAEPPEERIIVPVEAQKPQRGPIAEYIQLTTRVEAERRVEVTAEGTGKCLSVRAEEGDRVKRGAVLAELDKADALAQFRQNQVQVKQSEADYERAKEMLAGDLISQAEYDNAYYSYQNALATLDTQRLTLDNLTVRAPIAGIVTARHIQEGMLVSSGTPVFEIVDPSSYVLTINPPEPDLPRLHVGQAASFTAEALPGEEFRAEIRRINPTVDAASGTVKVQLGIAPEVQKKLREGAFVEVRLVMATQENALLVPKDAVIEENARKYVFVVREEAPEEDAEADASQQENAESAAEPGGGSTGSDVPPEAVEPAEEEPRMVARRVEVEVGIEDSSFAEITGGITDEDWVVTLGQKNLKPGTEVVLTTAAAEIEERGSISEKEALEKAKVEHEAIEARKAFEEAAAKEDDQDAGE